MGPTNIGKKKMKEIEVQFRQLSDRVASRSSLEVLVQNEVYILLRGKQNCYFYVFTISSPLKMCQPNELFLTFQLLKYQKFYNGF